jgi:hypothetical protein
MGLPRRSAGRSGHHVSPTLARVHAHIHKCKHGCRQDRVKAATALQPGGAVMPHDTEAPASYLP